MLNDPFLFNTQLYIHMHMTMDPEEFAPFAQDEMPIGEEPINVIRIVEPSNEWTQMHDTLAQEIFVEWNNRQRN
ncbi:hypothetical protein L6164_002019 [Bauhinia variegata]|uniref:Uncharacterized protein n=1 Tax=Bauhinia variegata TaxID=167791 RepID=A0ACB9PZN8_BAUVA|nr:hypothetical protein L6164_002019 [Bauhinia variegata]